MNESFDTVTESTSVLDTAKNFGLDHKEAIVAGAASAATIGAVWAGMAFLNRKKAAKVAAQHAVAALVTRAKHIAELMAKLGSIPGDVGACIDTAVKAWNAIAADMESKMTKGELTVNDNMAIYATGILTL